MCLRVLTEVRVKNLPVPGSPQGAGVTELSMLDMEKMLLHVFSAANTLAGQSDPKQPKRSLLGGSRQRLRFYLFIDCPSLFERVHSFWEVYFVQS